MLLGPRPWFDLEPNRCDGYSGGLTGIRWAPVRFTVEHNPHNGFRNPTTVGFRIVNNWDFGNPNFWDFGRFWSSRTLRCTSARFLSTLQCHKYYFSMLKRFSDRKNMFFRWKTWKILQNPSKSLPNPLWVLIRKMTKISEIFGKFGFFASVASYSRPHELFPIGNSFKTIVYG